MYVWLSAKKSNKISLKTPTNIQSQSPTAADGKPAFPPPSPRPPDMSQVTDKNRERDITCFEEMSIET